MTIPRPKLTARGKTSSRISPPRGIWDAEVTQIDETADPNEVWVKIPRNTADYEYGPIPYIGPHPKVGDPCFVSFREGRPGDPVAHIPGSSTPQTYVVTGSAGGSSQASFDPGEGRKWVITANVTVAGELKDYDNDQAYVQVTISFSSGEEGSLSRTFTQKVTEAHQSFTCNAGCTDTHDHSLDHDAQPCVTGTMARTISEATTVTVTSGSNCGGFMEGYITAEIVDH